MLAQTLELAPVDDLLAGVVSVHPAKAQIDHDVFDIGAYVLRQVGRLLQYGAQNVAVIWIAREGACTQHQVVFVRDHHRALDTKLVGLSGFAVG